MNLKFIDQLKASILRKQKKNPKFSMRLMAKNLGLSHSFLSQVLSRKKEFPIDRLDRLIEVLELDDFAKRRLLESLVESQISEWQQKSSELGEHLKQTMFKSKSSVRVYEEIPISKMSLINPWFTMALLDLVESSNFQVNYQWMAERLGITVYQAQSAWVYLTTNNFVVEQDNQWKKTDVFLRLPVLKSTETVSQHYLQILKKIEDTLTKKSSDADYNNRLIVGATCTTNPKKIAEVKQYLEDTLYIAAEELAEGSCSEVYYVMISAIPLTQK